MDEFSFIRNYLAPLAGFGSLSLGDDIALLDNKHDYGFSTDTIGPWSGSTNEEQKIRKLTWMQRILELLNGDFSKFIAQK